MVYKTWRISLTRRPYRNMDDLQSRCERLEAILCATNPSLDIKELLNDNNPPFTMPTLQNIVQPGSDAHSVASTGITTPDDNPGTPDSLDGVDLTAKAHSFEWREVPASADEQDKLADGMASLNLDSRDVGYLGGTGPIASLHAIELSSATSCYAHKYFWSARPCVALGQLQPCGDVVWQTNRRAQ